MDFFGDLGKKISKTYNVAEEKANKVARETKLKFNISEMENNINEEYVKLGQKVYEKYLNKREDENALEYINEFKNIDKYKENIENAKNEIEEIKDKKKCLNCGVYFEKSFEYCPNCGTKYEKIYEAEIVKEDEKK